VEKLPKHLFDKAAVENLFEAVFTATELTLDANHTTLPYIVSKNFSLVSETQRTQVSINHIKLINYQDQLP